MNKQDMENLIENTVENHESLKMEDIQEMKSDNIINQLFSNQVESDCHHCLEDSSNPLPNLGCILEGIWFF